MKRLPDWSQWQISHLLQRDKISSTKFQNEHFLPTFSWIYILGRCSVFAQQLKKVILFMQNTDLSPHQKIDFEKFLQKIIPNCQALYCLIWVWHNQVNSLAASPAINSNSTVWDFSFGFPLVHASVYNFKHS